MLYIQELPVMELECSIHSKLFTLSFSCVSFPPFSYHSSKGSCDRRNAWALYSPHTHLNCLSAPVARVERHSPYCGPCQQPLQGSVMSLGVTLLKAGKWHPVGRQWSNRRTPHTDTNQFKSNSCDTTEDSLAWEPHLGCPPIRNPCLPLIVPSQACIGGSLDPVTGLASQGMPSRLLGACFLLHHPSTQHVTPLFSF